MRQTVLGEPSSLTQNIKNGDHLYLFWTTDGMEGLEEYHFQCYDHSKSYGLKAVLGPLVLFEINANQHVQDNYFI